MPLSPLHTTKYTLTNFLPAEVTTPPYFQWLCDGKTTITSSIFAKTWKKYPKLDDEIEITADAEDSITEIKLNGEIVYEQK